MTENFDAILESYKKAGSAVIAARKLAKKIVNPGVPFLDIANQCEAEIIKSGAELSFPINNIDDQFNQPTIQNG